MEGYCSLAIQTGNFFDAEGGRAWKANRGVKKITERARAYSSLLAEQ